MSIIIKPHGINADVEVSTPAEAAAVLVGLKTPGQILAEAVKRAARPAEEAARKHPGWSGIFHADTAETAAGVPKEADVDLTDTAAMLAEKDGEKAPRNRTWTAEEESVLKRGIRDGKKCREIGEYLGRSQSSVRNKLDAMERERAVLNLTPIKPKKVTA